MPSRLQPADRPEPEGSGRSYKQNALMSDHQGVLRNWASHLTPCPADPVTRSGTGLCCRATIRGCSLRAFRALACSAPPAAAAAAEAGQARKERRGCRPGCYDRPEMSMRTDTRNMATAKIRFKVAGDTPLPIFTPSGAVIMDIGITQATASRLT